MSYWLLKSEPDVWSWEDQCKVSSEPWNGIRNHQASNNMKMMKLGHKGFFYHSNIGKEIVGIIEITKEYYPDPTDASGKFCMVEVKALTPLLNRISLQQLKIHPVLKNMKVVKQTRLSVSPVTKAEWEIVCKLGGINPVSLTSIR